MMEARIRVWIEDEKHHIMGNGLARLLSLIDKLGSIRAAANKMKMSYRKAWGIIQTLENNLGFPVIERSIGGAQGGGSTLTKQGGLLLKQYLAYNKAVDGFAQKKFKELFLIPLLPRFSSSR